MKIKLRWFIGHFIGLILMISGGVSSLHTVIIAPGVFGAIAGVLYVVGTIKMIETLKGSSDDQG